MSFDLEWDHQFCLACDKQTDGATYCSESCRLADYEKTASTLSSGASSPALTGPSQPWSLSRATPSSTNTKFYLSPAYDFSNPRPYGSASPARRGAVSQNPSLSPSSSYNSLSSLTSTASTEACTVSDKAKRELRAYASSFDQVRLQRRRSQ